MKTTRFAAILLLCGIAAFCCGGSDAPESGDKVTNATIKMLQKTLAAKKQEIEKLKGEIKKAREPVEAEAQKLRDRIKVLLHQITSLQSENQKLKRENAALKQTIDLIAGKKKGLKVVPFTGEETALIKVKARPLSYVDKSFIAVGGIQVDDFYLYGYGDAKRTHFSLDFQELRQDMSRTHEKMYVYAKRSEWQELVDHLTKVKAAGSDLKLIRVKVTIPKSRYQEGGGSRFTELLDYQFLSKDGKSWGKWARGGS